MTIISTLIVVMTRLRYVYTHFKSCDQSVDKASFYLSYIFCAMQTFAMSAKNSIIPKLSKCGHMI